MDEGKWVRITIEFAHNLNSPDTKYGNRTLHECVISACFVISPDERRKDLWLYKRFKTRQRLLKNQKISLIC